MTTPGINEKLAVELTGHSAVADAVVLGTTERVAYLVPDERAASLLHRAGALATGGRLDGLAWHEPADDLMIAGVNRTETDFLHSEVNLYFQHGITLPADAVVIDAGANIGMFTLRVARYSPRARIVAIEPMAELARALTVNAELHGADVTVLDHGLGSEPGEVDFTFYPNNSVMSGYYGDSTEDRAVLRDYLLTGRSAPESSQLDDLVADRMAVQRRRCRVTTLTEVVRSAQLTRIDLLKVDVEKAEADVLAGIDDETWSKIDQIVLEVHDIEGRLGRVVDLLTSRGFGVVHDRDERLSVAAHHSVYGIRPGRLRQPAVVAPPVRWPTLRALSEDLRNLLAGRYPASVLPNRFVLVPSLDSVAGNGSDPAGASSGAAAQALAEIWAELFGAAAVREDADLFELGANSLTVVRLLIGVEERLGENVLAPDVVFTTGRFADLVTAIESGLTGPAS